MRLLDTIQDFLFLTNGLGFEIKAIEFKAGDKVFDKLRYEAKELNMFSDVGDEVEPKVCGVIIRECE